MPSSAWPERSPKRRSNRFRTLLIDTGSPAWSIYGVEPLQTSTNGGNAIQAKPLPNLAARNAAPDVIPLPDDVRGVYDVIAGRLTLDECVLTEEESPLLMALAPGEMPLRWTDLLRSAGMRRLLAAARAVADVVLDLRSPSRRVPRANPPARRVERRRDRHRRGTADAALTAKSATSDAALLEFELAATRVLEPEPHDPDSSSPRILLGYARPNTRPNRSGFHLSPRNRAPRPNHSRLHTRLEASLRVLILGAARGGPPSLRPWLLHFVHRNISSDLIFKSLPTAYNQESAIHFTEQGETAAWIRLPLWQA